MELTNVSALGAAVGIVCTGYVIAYALARFTLRNSSGGCAWELADIFFHVPYVPLVLYLVLCSVRKLGANVDARWHQRTDETQFFLALYIVQCSVHVGVLCLKRHVGTPGMYVVHHTLSIACFGSALWTGRMHFWAALNALCEVTNIPLNTVFLFKSLKWDTSLATMYKLNGLFLWLSYIAFRIVLFPIWLFLFCRDVRSDPHVTWDRINTFERYAYSLTTGFLLAISLAWFGQITSGLIKALSYRHAKAQ